ncbi:MAG: HNH endonuclease [Mycobacterium sp.]|uniref:HNH endonuclease signature motif containing protein n=1 Tax=Mycobacterium sp. TaxID=1785 RepID=UPI001ECCF77B|nr:HNH endonuclease signature motif containing protein [Mycobacterium sp.]MBW0016038.1 HNH endonuclease [Mycobacterium sp.]
MLAITAPERVAAAFDALDTAVAALGELGLDKLSPVVRLRALERLETAQRRQTVMCHDVIAGLAKEDPADMGGPVHRAVADWLRISYAEARRRLRNAEQLSARLTPTGQQLPPKLPATAQVWRQGLLDAQHLRVIQTFCRDLPHHIPAVAVEHAERFLAHQATQLRPDQLDKVANRCALYLNPDGKFDDADRARQRGFTWCAQRADGMSVGKLVASPELRANLDAWLAKFAAPGMGNPDDETPCVAGEPTDEAASTDRRTPAQRQHDAINALVRGQLGDPKFGLHNGLPVTVIVSTTLQELTAAAGYAVTASGTRVPMRDLIRMGRHAFHYLAVFDEHTTRPLYLGRTRRIASPDQRLVLYAKDRGCTHPGCDVPADRCEVHHTDDWAAGGRTDVDKLTLACAPNHKLVGKGWKTTKLPNGRTAWIPPPHLVRGRSRRQPRTNTYHHPERLFGGDEDDHP